MRLRRWVEPLCRAFRRMTGPVPFPEGEHARLKSLQVAPRTYLSPSGEYVLEVDPSHRDGSGPANYRARRRGQEVWAKDLPFTLREVVVTDDGVVAGYAYSHGPQNDGFPRREFGDFRVVILAPGGEVRLDHVTPREYRATLHAPPYPHAVGMFLDAGNDRFTIRLRDPDRYEASEDWWPFQLSTGAVLPPFTPALLMDGYRRGMSINHARPVCGTPLTVVQWSSFYPIAGARFTLIGLDGCPVWCLDLPRDYTFPDDKKAEDRCRYWIWRHGAILGSDRPGEFELRHVAAGRRVTYAVERAGSRWKVRERGRRPYRPSPAPVDPVAEIPIRSLEFREAVTLRAPGDTVSEVRGVTDFALDGQGRFALLRREEAGPHSFLLLSPEGEVLRTVRLDAVPLKDEWECRGLAWVGGDSFVLARSPRQGAGESDVWRIDLATGAVARVAGFPATCIRRISGRADGTFVVLGSSSSSGNLYAFDAQGRKQWELLAVGRRDPASFAGSSDFAITTSGTLASLEARRTIQCFDRHGHYLRTFSLEESWGRRPNYVSTIVADVDDGFVVHDFNGPHPLVRMRADGSVRAELTPQFVDGRPVTLRQIAVDPDGYLWAWDGFSLLRLDASGQVDRVIGQEPSTEHLGDIAEVRVNRGGTIYAQARRTGAVHVFDREGCHRHVCRPGPTALQRPDHGAALAVTDQGHVYIGYTAQNQFLHFGPDGQCLGVAGGVNLHGTRWYFGPDGETCWIEEGRRIRRVSPHEDERQIERGPDKSWLDRPAVAVMPDGSLALLNESAGERQKVHLYAPDGTPRCSFEPHPVLGKAGAIAHDGGRVVLGCEHGVVAYDSTGKPLWSFSPSAARRGGWWWIPFLVEGGELWLYDGRDTLYQYVLPDGGRRRNGEAR